MQEKWEMSCWETGHRYLPDRPSKDEEWIAHQVKLYKEHINFWKAINPKNKRQLVQFITRACTFSTYNYLIEPFSTNELRCAYEMYMDQKIIPSKTRLGFFVLGQFNSLSKIIKKANFPKHIESFYDLTRTNFGPEIYNALSKFAREIDQYEKYNRNWQDYIPLELALQKRSLIPTNVKIYSYKTWNYKEQKNELRTHRSFYEQNQPWKFIGLISRETKHVRDNSWTNSPWYKEIRLEQKLLGN